MVISAFGNLLGVKRAGTRQVDCVTAGNGLSQFMQDKVYYLNSGGNL